MKLALHTFALGTALCLGLGTAAAFAQEATPQTPTADQGQSMHHGRGPMSVDDQLEHMSKALSLTSNQQTQIKPLLEARREQMMQMHQDQSMSHDDRMTKMKALDDDTHAKIDAVLNDSQKAKFAKMQEKREQHMESHGDGNAGSGQPQ